MTKTFLRLNILFLYLLCENKEMKLINLHHHHMLISFI